MIRTEERTLHFPVPSWLYRYHWTTGGGTPAQSEYALPDTGLLGLPGTSPDQLGPIITTTHLLSFPG